MLLWTLTAVGWQPYAVQIPCCIVLFCSLFLIIIARYDAKKSHAYIGDSAGQITIMTVTDETSHKVDTMKRHTGRYCLNWFCLLYIAYDVPVNPQCSLYAQFVVPFEHFFISDHHHNHFTALFPGSPGWAGARRELLDFMVHGKINRGKHTDHPAEHHSIRTKQCPPPSFPMFFFTGRIPFLPPNQQCQSTEGKFFLFQTKVNKLTSYFCQMMNCDVIGYFSFSWLWQPVAMDRPLYFPAVVYVFFLLFSSPILSGCRVDVYHTSTCDVTLVRI